MVINIWQSIVKRRVKVSRQIDILQAVINVLDEHFDEMADPDGTVDTRLLTQPTFVGRLKEEVVRMRGDVRTGNITSWFKNRYNNWLRNILGRANNRLRDYGYHFHHHSGGSNPRSSFISRLRSIEKEDWRKKASEDFRDTSDELMALQQLLFYMEELLKMLKKPNPDIKEMINFLEYNVETLREEYT